MQAETLPTRFNVYSSYDDHTQAVSSQSESISMRAAVQGDQEGREESK